MQTLDQAVASISDGARLGIGGVLLKRKPMRFLAALTAAGRKNLSALTFLGSLDIELLAAADALAEFRGGYVGFEQLGFAPAFKAAVESGRVMMAEYSEFMFVAGLRAAGAGLPFLPSKGGLGSDLVNELGLAEISDPYTGQRLLAIPALNPQVSVIHAHMADRDGNVLGPDVPDFLSDFDINLARASDRVVVTTEKVVDRLPGPAALFGYEVSAVVELANGAAPTALPGSYPSNTGVIRRYLELAVTDRGAALYSLLKEIG